MTLGQIPQSSLHHILAQQEIAQQAGQEGKPGSTCIMIPQTNQQHGCTQQQNCRFFMPVFMGMLCMIVIMTVFLMIMMVAAAAFMIVVMVFVMMTAATLVVMLVVLVMLATAALVVMLMVLMMMATAALVVMLMVLMMMTAAALIIVVMMLMMVMCVFPGRTLCVSGIDFHFSLNCPGNLGQLRN